MLFALTAQHRPNCESLAGFRRPQHLRVSLMQYNFYGGIAVVVHPLLDCLGEIVVNVESQYDV